MSDLVKRLLRQAADRIDELEADNQSNFDRAQTAIRERDEWKRKYDALVDSIKNEVTVFAEGTRCDCNDCYACGLKRMAQNVLRALLEDE